MKINKEKLQLELDNSGWYALAIRLNHSQFRSEKYKDLPLTNIDKMVEYLYGHIADDKEAVRSMVESCCESI